MTTYDDLKRYKDEVYSGMKIGTSHQWTYPDGQWQETKVAPDKWKFAFDSIKSRNHTAAEQTGAAEGTVYHWYLLADQKATKLDANSYQTNMTGLKFKIGHKRPQWRSFTYEYDDQPTYRERVIKVLEETLAALKQSEDWRTYRLADE